MKNFAWVAIIALALTACPPPDPTTTTYTVTFNSNGGSAVSSITEIESGATIAKPTDPTKADYTFDGWYTDNDTFANAWDFATDTVTANITLYAKWLYIVQGGENKAIIVDTRVNPTQTLSELGVTAKIESLLSNTNLLADSVVVAIMERGLTIKVEEITAEEGTDGHYYTYKAIDGNTLGVNLEWVTGVVNIVSVSNRSTLIDTMTEMKELPYTATVIR